MIFGGERWCSGSPRSKYWLVVFPGCRHQPRRSHCCWPNPDWSWPWPVHCYIPALYWRSGSNCHPWPRPDDVPMWVKAMAPCLLIIWHSWIVLQSRLHLIASTLAQESQREDIYSPGTRVFQPGGGMSIQNSETHWSLFIRAKGLPRKESCYVLVQVYHLWNDSAYKDGRE